MQARKRYRKRPTFYVTAIQLDLHFYQLKFYKWGDKQICKPGDWLVYNAGDTYTVDKEYFRDHYQRVSQGVYKKIGEVWAEVATKDGCIATKEGSTAYLSGDYLVFDRTQGGGDGYAIKKQIFERMYEELDVSVELTVDQKNYINQRIQPNINKFKTKAKRNRNWYYTYQTIAIISAALVPVISGNITGDVDDVYKWTVAILGGASAVTAGLLSLFKYQEDWFKYQSAYRDLDSHLSQFNVAIGSYCDNEQKFQTLAENCESILKAEVGQWAESKNRTKKESEAEA